MPRINIEDDIESRPEWKRLVKILNGNDREAMGMLVEFWRHAQKCWGAGELVSPAAVKAWGWEPLVESMWAIEREGQYYAIGSEERFAWYKQRCNAGRSRSNSQRSYNGQYASGTERNSIPYQLLTLTPSLTPSPSLKTKKEESKGIALTRSPQPVASPVAYFIGTWVKAFQGKYGDKTRPDLRGKVQGQIKRYLGETSIERACAMAQVYFQMPEKWFETKHHDFTTFLENQNKIGVALDTGQSFGSIDWGKVFGDATEPAMESP